jgi:hypothetical protein
MSDRVSVLERARRWARPTRRVTRERELYRLRRVTRERELYRLRRAIARTNEHIERMHAATEPHDCCTACRFGREYTRTLDKLTRQELWLGVLEKKPL